jgi:hypothetical protein
MIFSLFDERDEKERWGMMENKSQWNDTMMLDDRRDQFLGCTQHKYWNRNNWWFIDEGGVLRDYDNTDILSHVYPSLGPDHKNFASLFIACY